jgi:hypothetical protein
VSYAFAYALHNMGAVGKSDRIREDLANVDTVLCRQDGASLYASGEAEQPPFEASRAAPLADTDAGTRNMDS